MTENPVRITLDRKIPGGRQQTTVQVETLTGDHDLSIGNPLHVIRQENPPRLKVSHEDVGTIVFPLPEVKSGRSQPTELWSYLPSAPNTTINRINGDTGDMQKGRLVIKYQ